MSELDSFLKDNIQSAYEICKTDYPPIKWIIKGLLPEGLTILGGNPKVGKSWMVLNWALMITTNKEIQHNNFNYEVTSGDVLYISLEDNKRRLKDRINKCCGGKDGHKNLHGITEWKHIGSGGLRLIENYLTNFPNTVMVVIDPLVYLWPEFGEKHQTGQTIYHYDYKVLSKVKKIANKFSVSIVIIHHLSKSKKNIDHVSLLSGSMAFGGAVDTLMILQRPLSVSRGTLYINGRDIENERIECVELDKETGWWSFHGDNSSKKTLSDTQIEVINYFKQKKEPVKLKQICEEMNKSKQNVYNLLYSLIDMGYIKKAGFGLYNLRSITPTYQR